jgi:hypothetical protein
MRRRGESIKAIFDIHFGSTGDDDFEPRNVCGRAVKSPQDVWTTLSATTLIKCVNDKDESPCWEARKFADEVKEESAASLTLVSHLGPYEDALRQCFEKGGDYREFVDECRKDICGLAQIRVIPPAEKCSS